jgi:hypothetical protein
MDAVGGITTLRLRFTGPPRYARTALERFSSYLSNIRGDSMTHDARRQTVQAYFDGLGTKDLSRIPWAENATLRTPLNPTGGDTQLIHGRKAIMEFFSGILPAVRSLKMLRYYSGDDGWAAGQAEIALANGKTLYVLDAFRIENGRIAEQQNHYDSRPATG